MPGQIIGTVNVQVNKQQNSTVRSLNYGIRSLKGSTDLSLTGVQDNDVIVYQANTNSFKVQSIGELIIQFFYHLTNKGTNSYNLTPPLQIDSRFTDNEFSTRICTEVATRYLYAKNHEQHLLFDQLNAYCRNSGNNWIMNLLHSVR
jgi:hypothetical protein